MNEHLGRGLSALIPDHENKRDTRADLSTLPIERIRTNPYQPRQTFDPESLSELAESIRVNGIIQPLIVNKTEGSDYELIAGERRLQAAKLAGLDLVPVVIRSVSPKEQLQLAIVENVQREDLDPIEEARAYQALAEDFNLTHQDIAQIMSKDRATISNSIRLLKLPEEVQGLVSQGSLSSGHARAVLAVEQHLQPLFAQHLVQYRLTVRQAEEKAKSFGHSPARPALNAEAARRVKDLESELQNALGLKARIIDLGGKGRITLNYSSPEQLLRLQELLNKLRSV